MAQARVEIGGGSSILEENQAREETTHCLAGWGAGCRESGEEALRRVYPDLRRLARASPWRLPTLDSTSDYAQELCFRLFQQRSFAWRSRGHFLAIAGKLMRRIAVDEGRRAQSGKRGGDRRRVPLEGLAGSGPTVDVLDLDRALTELAQASPSAAQVVELRYFAGMNIDEAAEVLGIGRATVQRRWRFARAWLAARLRRTVDDWDRS